MYNLTLASVDFPAGSVCGISVKEGDDIKKGDELISLECMKSIWTVSSPIDGTIIKILIQEGEVVEVDTVLMHIKEKKNG